VRFLQNRIEDRDEITGGGIDDLQDLGGRGFSIQRLVALSLVFIALGRALVQFALKISDDLLRIS
jgi:hypothetical protein